MTTKITPHVMFNAVRVAFFITLLILMLSGFKTDGDKITICHMPPGNPGNCHEITISVNALQTHLDHGDKLHCYSAEDYPAYLGYANNNADAVIKMY